MLFEIAQRGNFFTTWLVLTVLAFVMTVLMSGTLFALYYWRPTFETWQRKSNPEFPKPSMVRREVLQMLKGIFTATFCPALALHLVNAGWSHAYAGLGGRSVGYLVFTFFVVWIGSDFYEFAYHRLGHVYAFWWKQHKPHHVFFNPSPFAVIADDYVDQFIRSAPLLFIPMLMPVNMDLLFFTYGAFFYGYGVYLHWGYELSWLGAHQRFVNTSFQHYVHHARSTLNKPMHTGFFFKIWDQIAGSEYRASPDSCLCARCCTARGERTREAFDAVEKPDYSPLLRPSFWIRKTEPAARAALFVIVIGMAFALGACSSSPATQDGGTDGAPPTDGGATDSPATSDATSDTTPPSDAGAHGQSLIWVWNDYANSLATVFANPKSFTHVSPTLYDINYAYTSGVAEFTSSGKTDSFDGLTSTQIAQQVHAAGMKCVPLVFGGAGNAGTDQGIHNILDDSPSGTQNAFITSMVNEAVTKGYDGYNLDWEVDTSQTTYAAYGAKLETFLAAFKAALHQHGMQLSFDLGTWYLKQTYCSGGNGVVDLTAIAPNVDLAIQEAYSKNLGTQATTCPASLPDPQLCSDDFASEINLMCVYVPNAAISIGFNANPTSGSNDVAGAVVAMTQAYGIHNVAIWPDYNTDGTNGAYVFLDAKNISPTNTTWFKLLADFLAAQ